ncbi:GlsB/YeaQ/YmgE family stress response membrane protein [Stratiformator vulcanicus]|uniref:Transglycosylase associated protein n=1 Tax=Stratiformator vulcanicus TaxID=2527980 RepID=A0A517QYG6_9PLAN|nr:GlsB/YeaQ/YmgE family stress response membrane protein [Stratiformator vulcanicus]QDT36697.1 hypothetical protein Pan189_10590 [Stratiformator vulcanicus]
MGTVINVILWIIFGAFCGGIAQFLVPGKQNLGWIASIALGVVGSFVGGFLWTFFQTGQGQFSPGGIIMSIVGATVLLAIYVFATKRR